MKLSILVTIVLIMTSSTSNAIDTRIMNLEDVTAQLHNIHPATYKINPDLESKLLSLDLSNLKTGGGMKNFMDQFNYVTVQNKGTLDKIFLISLKESKTDIQQVAENRKSSENKVAIVKSGLPQSTPTPESSMIGFMIREFEERKQTHVPSNAGLQP